ncbi:protein spinster-like protein 2-like [Hibiscus syriacus]|uniref:Protein spinster-like protein 2-like n=1 Tax=Hibiscus syriacus TaxID=106335 RepID=A0A6A2WVN0_HIBSY|nr:protein spinster-like protein 2-like [Hibiscus syriacus]
MKSETLTLVLVNLARIMERADESLLPSVYKEVGADLHTDPTGLRSLALYRSIVQSCCYPLAAYLAMHHNRAHVISLGAFLWAAATFLVAISTTFLQVGVSRGLNGIGLAIVIPAIQSLVADSTDDSNDGSALSFSPMWLELIGFSHETTALIMTLFMISGTLGGLFGGRMGDILAKCFLNSGRIILSQISASSAIPIAVVLMMALPDDPSTAIMHEILPEKSRTSIYALDNSFESIPVSFAPPIVGILAQHVYGYKPIPKGSSDSIEIETDRENAASLAKALYLAFAIPLAVCCLIYSFLYCSYPRDRERAQMQTLIESEMQQLEQNDPSSSCLFYIITNLILALGMLQQLGFFPKKKSLTFDVKLKNRGSK